MATAKLYFDKRKSKSPDAVGTLKIQIGHRSSNGYICLDVKLTEKQWDKGNGRIVGHPQKLLLNKAVQVKLGQVNSILLEISQSENIMALSNSELCRKVKERLNPEKETKEKEPEDTVKKYFERYVRNKELRPNSAEKYNVAWRRIEAWLGKAQAAKLRFADINLAWLEDFDKFLAQNSPSPNGRRLHHSCLKAVINYAIDHEVADRNPYRRYKIKTVATRKRNMDVDALRRVLFAQDLEPWMEKYRDFFALSFMLRGLNTVDLCSLPKPVNGRVDWIRTKTGQPMSLKIEPEMQYLIDKYAGEKLMLSFAEHRPYRNFNETLTKALHKICAHINASGNVEVPDFTMYWARHSWATIAARLDISDGIIGEGLAHSEKTVLDIYIERDPGKVDIANRRVLDFVLYGKDYRQPEAEPPKRKRGRPRKIRPAQEETMEEKKAG